MKLRRHLGRFLVLIREFMDAIKGVLVYVGRPRSEMLGGDGSRAYTAPNGSPQAKMSDAADTKAQGNGAVRGAAARACVWPALPTLVAIAGVRHFSLLYPVCHCVSAAASRHETFRRVLATRDTIDGPGNSRSHAHTWSNDE